LLVLQTGVIALGALPIFLIARKLVSVKVALLFAAAYLINPATLSLNIYDFHLEAFLPFFLGMFYYSYLAERWRSYALFLVLSIITIDFACVMVVAISLTHGLAKVSGGGRGPGGIRLGLDRFKLKLLLATVVTALVSLYLVIFLSGQFSGTSVSVQGVLSGFVSPMLAGQTLVLKSEFWIIPLVSLMFLPLLAPRQLIMVAPWFAVTLLSAAGSSLYSLGYQYAGAFVVPFLIIAAIFAVEKLRKHHFNTRGLLVGVLVFSIAISPFSPLAAGRISGIAYQEGLPVVTAHDQVLDAAIDLVPANASVLTQNNLFPQVSNRADAFVYLTNEKTPIDYILADSMSSWYSSLIWGTQSMKYWLPYYIAKGDYGILVDDDGVLLLKANYTGPVVLSGPTVYKYDYTSLDLYSGTEEAVQGSPSGTVLVHTASDQSGVTFWFGPYAALPPGEYTATFTLMSTASTVGSLELQVSNFLNSTTAELIVQRDLNQSSFAEPGTWSQFTVTFDYTPQQAMAGTIEFRGADVSGGTFYMDDVTVTYLGPSAS
jgi:uncharacterized membrane protein